MSLLTGCATALPMQGLGVGIRAGLLGVSLGAAACAQTEPEGAPRDRQAAAAPVTAEASAPPTGAAPRSCNQIRAALKREYTRLAKQPQVCSANSDCTLYGGPECPNELIRSCPGAVNRRSLAAVQPLAAAWSQQDCGPYLWSPFSAEVRCDAGLCEAH